MAVTVKDLLEEARGRVLEQLRGKISFDALLEIFTTQATELQTALLQILDDTVIADSEGAQLDGIGRIVGESRFGRSDADYRNALLARILLNKSRGTIEDILGVLLAELDGVFTLQFTEHAPAGYLLYVVEAIDPLVNDPVRIGNVIQQARAAGVKGHVHFHVAGPFQYDAGLGFDDGKYADVF
jgi:hypothetical protein